MRGREFLAAALLATRLDCGGRANTGYACLLNRDAANPVDVTNGGERVFRMGPGEFAIFPATRESARRITADSDMVAVSHQPDSTAAARWVLNLRT